MNLDFQFENRLMVLFEKSAAVEETKEGEADMPAKSGSVSARLNLRTAASCGCCDWSAFTNIRQFEPNTLTNISF